MASVTCEIQWLQYLLSDFQVLSTIVALYCDNISALKIAENPVFHKRTKHIEIDCHLVRQKVQQGLLRLFPISTSHQLDDCFIKPLPPPTFKRSVLKLGIQNLYTPSCGGLTKSTSPTEPDGLST